MAYKWETNRIKRRTPDKKRKFWCGGCDANLVGRDKKCGVCGKRNSKGKRQDK